MKQTKGRTQYVKCLLTLLIFTLMLTALTIPAFAQYPERNGQLIIDENEYFSTSDKSRYESLIDKLQHEYIIVFIDRTDIAGNTYAQGLFEHYELTDNTLLFVLEVDFNNLYYALGDNLVEKGLTTEIIERIKQDTLDPRMPQGEYLNGFNLLIQALEREMRTLTQKKERSEAVVINDRPEEPVPQEKQPMPGWLKALFAAFGLLIVFFVASYFYRRRLLKIVDSLEREKVRLENRPLAMDAFKRMEIKMNGEIEKRFDIWRERWEYVINQSLGDIEEAFMDIEDYAYSYRFIKAKKVIKATEARLAELDKQLLQIYEEVEGYAHREKESREKITQLKDKFQTIYAKFQADQLAFGIAYPAWIDRLKKARGWFEEYQLAQDRGDLDRAQDYLEAITEVCQHGKEALKSLPRLVTELEQQLPKELKELEQAIEEMKTGQYQLDHTNVFALLNELKEGKSQAAVALMEKGQPDKIENWLSKQRETIESIYKALEQEVKNKQIVHEFLQHSDDKEQKVVKLYQELAAEVEKTKISYTWEKEWQSEFERIAEIKDHLIEKFNLLTTEETREGYAKYLPHVLSIDELYQEFNERHGKLTKTVRSIREDELKAQEMVKTLQSAIIQVKLILKKSNLPGVPEHLRQGVKLAEEYLSELQEIMQQTPVNVHKIQYQLHETKDQVTSITELAKSCVEQAKAVEFLIPFAWRYKRSSPSIGITIEQAEQLFRQYQYSEALELMEEALDRVDPEWREQLELQHS